MSDFREVKEQINILEYISREHQTRMVGRHPFLEECPVCKSSQGFSIHKERQTWKCFACDGGGDIFDFLLFIGRCGTKYEALLMLAKEIGYEIKKPTESKAVSDEKRIIREIFTETAKYYKGRLSTKAKNYLRKERGRDDITIKRAWYGESDGDLHKHLLTKFNREVVIKSGVVGFDKGNNNVYDNIRKGSTVYPHFYNGQVVDFTYKNYNLPKDKRKNFQISKEKKLSLPPFYGKNAISFPAFVIVEGEEDRLSFLQYYDYPVVTIIGNLSGDQLEFLKEKCSGKTIYMAFDPDSEGRKYEERIMNALGDDNTICKCIWDKNKGDIDKYLRGVQQDCEKMGIRTLMKEVWEEISKPDKQLIADINEFLKKKKQEPLSDELLKAVKFYLNDKLLDDESEKALISAAAEYSKQWEDAKIGKGVKNILDKYLQKEYMRQYVKELIETGNDYVSYRINTLPDMTSLSPHIKAGHYQPIAEWIARIDNEMIVGEHSEHLAKRLGAKGTYLPLLKKLIVNLRNPEDIQKLDIVDEKKKFDIYHNKNQYFRIDKKTDGHIKVSSFVMKINRYIEMDENIYYEIICTNSDNVISKPLLIQGADRVNRRNFVQFMADKGGRGFYFMGNDFDLQEIWLLEESKVKNLTTTCYFQRYGFIRDHNIWLYRNCAVQGSEVYPAGEDGVISVGKIGYLSKDVLIYSGDTPQLNVVFPCDHNYVNKITGLFRTMLDDDKSGFMGCLALGAIGCLVHLDALLKHSRKFPFLMLYGPSGNGKTEIMQLLMNILGFTHGGEPWGDSSTAGIAQAMEQLGSKPYWMEEFDNFKGKAGEQKKKIQLVKNLYNRTSTGKGGLKKRTMYETNAVLFFSGEDRPEGTGALSRFVILDKSKPGAKATIAFKELEKEKPNLSSIFLYFLKRKTSEKTKEVISMLEHIKETLSYIINSNPENNAVDERSLYNYSVLAAGFKVVFDPDNLDMEAFTEWMAKEILYDVQRKGKEDVLYQFFSSFETIFPDKYIILKKEGNTLYLAFYKAYSIWERDLHGRGSSVPMSKNGLYDYLKKDHRSYFISSGRKRFYDKKNDPEERRCIELQIDKMPDNLREFAESLTDEDVRREPKPGPSE